jgi:UDPglucose--hexose-1-phosphate uridylyltransferase
VQKIRIERADGRYVFIYALDRPPPPVLDVPQDPRGAAAGAGLELRWNALLGEWVIVSTGRQERTFLPPDDACPLCPTASAADFTTEIPAPDFEIAVFENRWPSFRPDAPAMDRGGWAERRATAAGVCEVVVYSADHAGTLASMTQRQVRQLVDVWTDRYEELAARPEVEYVFIFENRGKEIGVTLTHPHGQIYAFPFIPPRPGQEHEAAARHGSIESCLICDTAHWEAHYRSRIVTEADGFIAYVPFAARVPYELHVAAKEHRESLLDLTVAERDGLAAILREVQARYDALWGFAMPYTMSMHQKATDGVQRQGEHLHIEFLPPYRSRDKLKYLAGVETGAGTYINDTSPEEKAAELRGVKLEAGNEKRE